jgi:AcrR family transcriptional regulator
MTPGAPAARGRPRSVSNDTVFAAIAEVVTAQGPDKLTFARVAAQVDLSPAALVQRFGTKHQMLVEFARDAIGSTAAVFDDAARGRRPLAAVARALRDLTPDIDSPAGLANNLAFLQLDLTDPDLRPLAVLQSREIRARLTELLGRAVEAGHLFPADPASLADAAYTAYNGALVTWALDGRGGIKTWVQRRVEATFQPFRPTRRKAYNPEERRMSPG